MNTAIFRDRADLILYADADADADPPLTGQQRPGGGGGVLTPRVLTYMSYMGRSRGLAPPPLFKANLQHYWVWFPNSPSNRTIGWDF